MSKLFTERWQSWSIAFDLKSNEFNDSEGSNPSLSFHKISGFILIEN